MERTARLFGAEKTYYLVNGSTCGNLAAVMAAVGDGGEAIVAENCHISVHHAIELGHIKAHFLKEPKDPVYGIVGSVDPSSVEAAALEYPDSKAVVITSPTYEGIISDIEKIAKIAHSHGMALVVDEAHGAHLGLFSPENESSEAGREPAAETRLSPDARAERPLTQEPAAMPPAKAGIFPGSALKCGADAVVQSAHKTLPSLTQTALLHLTSGRIPQKSIEKWLRVFETSSPSYVLMASLDGCTALLSESGEELFRAWKARLDGFYSENAGLKHLRVLSPADFSDGTAYLLDRSKILISTAHAPICAAELKEELLQAYGIELEMAYGDTCVALTSCADDDESFALLTYALKEIDAALEACGPAEGTESREGSSAARTERQSESPAEAAQSQGGEGQGGAASRWEAHSEPQLAEGETLSGIVYAYPPGVPLFMSGHVIRQEDLRRIAELKAQGAVIVSEGKGPN